MKQLKLKVAEIFSSIQGEGRYAGYPMLFIRLSGCTRSCSWCDTKYHTKGDFMTIAEIVKRIKKERPSIVCWTGGEPLLQRDAIRAVRAKTRECAFHIETNGDLLEKTDFALFSYLGISPKVEDTAKKVKKITDEFSEEGYDIKVVTDLKSEGADMIKYATLLMPLTYTDYDKQTQVKVWEYCIKHRIRFCSRLQYYVFGKKRGI